MATWGEFEASEPRFAARVRKLMTNRKHLTMATLRRDGSPRISGTEVQFAGDHLQIGSMPRAVKAGDLIRDPRLAIHGPTRDPAKSGSWRGEAKIAGRAREVPGAPGPRGESLQGAQPRRADGDAVHDLWELRVARRGAGVRSRRHDERVAGVAQRQLPHHAGDAAAVRREVER